MTMRNALKSIACQHGSTASVVDGKLILSLPGALTPVVWQMDLAQAKASALEVLPAKDEQNFTLTLKNAKADNIDIATFGKRTEAVDALMAASRALASAHGQIRPADGTATASVRPRKRGRLIVPVLGILLLFALIAVWISLLPRAPGTEPGSASPAAMQTDSATAPSPGVPVSADDFLSR